MPFSAGLPRRVAVLATTLALALAGVSCSNERGDKDAKDPPTVPTASESLPELTPGRLVRILGSGTRQDLNGPSSARRSSVSSPMALTVGSDEVLYGWQSGFSAASQLFTVTPQGVATAVPDLSEVTTREAAPHAGWSLATLEVNKHLAVVHRGDDVELVDPRTGAVVGAVDLPKALPRTWSASLLPATTAAEAQATLRYGDRWFILDAAIPAAPTLTPIEAPISGALAAVTNTAGETLVLTRSELITLGPELSVRTKVPYPRPSAAEDSTIVAAAALPRDGIVAVVSAPPSGSSGQILHISADGAVTVLARGTGKVGAGCDDADTPTDQTYLTLPMSVAIWQKRIVVADTKCDSLLQLRLP